MHKTKVLLIVLLLVSQSACVLAGAGYSSGRGWFFWPGGVGLLVMLVIGLLFLITLFRR